MDRDFGNTTHALVTRLAYWSVASVVLVAFVDGFFIERVGFTRIETLYFAGILAVLFSWWTLNRSPILWVIYLLVLLGSLWLGVLLASGGTSRLIDDTRYFLRSYLLGVMVFMYIQSLNATSFNAAKFFKYQWLLMTLLVLVHFIFGFGGVSGRGGVDRTMYSSFFQEGNVIAFVYVVTWFYLYAQSYSTKWKTWISILSIIVAGLLSSKAAFISIPLLMGFHWLAYFKAASRMKAALANFVIIFSMVVGVVFFYELMDMLIKLMIMLFPDGAEMLYRLSTWDVLTVLTSTRDLRVIELYNDMHHYSVAELLFGIGFKEVLESRKLIESDFFDIIQAFGIVGVIMFYFPVMAAFWIIKKDRIVQGLDFNYYVFTLGAWYVTMFVSTATGHILLTPTAMILFGVIFGHFMSIRRQAGERMKV